PSRQTERQRRHDRQRMDETVELRREHHVDKRHCQQNGEDEIVGSASKVSGATAEHEDVSGLHVQLGGRFANRRHGIAQRQTIQTCLQRDLTLPVVALNIVRSVIQFQLRDIAQLYGTLIEISATNAARSAASGDQQTAQTGWVVAERLVESEQN